MANQVRNISKGSRTDKTWKVYFKKGYSSMLLFKDLTCYDAYARVNVLKKLFSNWHGQFIVTK